MDYPQRIKRFEPFEKVANGGSVKSISATQRRLKGHKGMATNENATQSWRTRMWPAMDGTATGTTQVHQGHSEKKIFAKTMTVAAHATKDGILRFYIYEDEAQRDDVESEKRKKWITKAKIISGSGWLGRSPPKGAALKQN